MAKNNKYPFRLFKRGNTWHAYISCVVAGRRIIIRETTGCPDETSATDWCIKRIDAIRKSPLATHEITLDAAADKWWLERGQFQDRHGLISRLKNLILEIGPNLLLSDITKNDLSIFISNCYTRGRGPATINRYLALLSAICSRAREYWDCNTPNFKILSFRQREPRENIKYFSDWQTVQTLIEHAAPHIRPIILTALYTGLRRGRILSLKWDQIDFENNIISYMGKDNKPHTVPMVNALRDVLSALPRAGEYVFTYRGKRINEFKNAWKHAFESSGIPYKNFHTLRHTTATWLLRQTGNLRLVQSVLGHSNITTTTKYAHLLNAAASDAMNDLFSQTKHKPE